jgi:transposase InsO family protein
VNCDSDAHGQAGHDAQGKTWAALKGAIHEYIHYYNVDRIKLGLGGLSPVEYRMKGAAALA